MIYFDENTQQFKSHTHTATYINTQDNSGRIKHTSDPAQWEEFVSRWGSNLQFYNINLTPEQTERLDLLNSQEHRCAQWDHQASLFVQHGVVLPHEGVPYLSALADGYEADTLAWAEAEFGHAFGSISEVEQHIGNGGTD